MRLQRFGIWVLALVVTFSSCKREEEPWDLLLDDALTEASNGEGASYFVLPATGDYSAIPQDPRNPLTADKVELGKMLYHETALGINPKLPGGEGTYSCASCHHAAAGFQANMAQGIGEGGMGFGIAGEGRKRDPNYPIDSLDIQPVRSPSALNVAWQECMLWNGQFGGVGLNSGTEANWVVGLPTEANYLGYEGVETQAIAGLKVHRMDIDTSFLMNDAFYGPKFQSVFSDFPADERVTRTTVGLAIAAYERTLLANEAPFQKWLNGDYNAMTDQQKEGATLFFGEAGCATCHTGPALNSMTFHALGMRDLDAPGTYAATGADAATKGRGGFTKRPGDMYKFKVPQLYNLKDSPFYGHGASFNTVLEVVEYFNRGLPENPNVDQGQISVYFRPLGLKEDQIVAIADFIENALYDPSLSRYEPTSIPSGQCFPNNDPQSRIDRGCN